MVSTDAPRPNGELIQVGFTALADNRWDEGRRYFEDALKHGESPEALEGLGLAAYWVDDVPVVFGTLERAYQLYRERGDRLGAARVAIMLGSHSILFRGEEAIANGWLKRAHRLLEGAESTFEQGQLTVMEGFLAIQAHHDVAAARTASVATLTLARAFGSVDLEVAALAMEGVALVYEGHVDEGMSRLDEATTAALAGEVKSLDTIMTTCCLLISACERVRDFERAAQWCEKVKEFCLRYRYRSMLAYCRTHYAAVLMWRGAWSEAESELLLATRELSGTRVGFANEGMLRLGELRRCQGRLDEAATLFAGVPGHAFSTLGRAALAFAAADAYAASDLIERFLRQVPAADLMERVDGLELALRIDCALGQWDRARTRLAELEAAAAAVGTPPLAGVVAAGRGQIAAATGEFDLARRHFEDAVDLFQRGGTPYESARARIELARTLSALGRRADATAEAHHALVALRDIGAGLDAAQAMALLDELGASPGARIPLPAGLTRREAEVLGLLARGLSNQEIAQHLFLSVRTVERHISTIYAKIGAEGPGARAAASAFAFTNGLALAAKVE